MASQTNRFAYSRIGQGESFSSQTPSSDEPSAMSTNWLGLWTNQAVSSLNNHDATGQDDSFTNGHQTSAAAFPTNADSSTIWPTTSVKMWNNADNNAAARRVAQSPTPANHNLFSIGQSGAYTTSRASTAGMSKDSSINNSTNALKYGSSLHEPVSEDDQAAAANNLTSSFVSLSLDTRTAQGSPNGFTPVSASASVTGSTSPGPVASDPTSVTNLTNNNMHSNFLSLSAFATVPSAYNGHSHRPSLHASTTFPSPATSAKAVPYHRNSQPEDSKAWASAQAFRQSLGGQHVPDLRNIPPLNAYNTDMPVYPQAVDAASFQPNPMTTSWTANAQLNGSAGLVPNMDPTAAHVYRSGIRSAGRGYANNARTLPGGVNSPRNYATAGSTANPWGQPPSQDLQMPVSLGSHMNSANNLLQHQQLLLVNPPVFGGYNSQVAAVANATASGGAAAFNGPTNFYQGVAHTSATPVMMAGTQVINPHIASQRPQARDRDPARSLRSDLLNDFRTHRLNRRYELKDFYGHFVEFSGDQHGSRFIQTKLETATSNEKERVFREICGDAVVLIKDVFGNYVIQKFFEHGNQIQKKYFAEQLRTRMVDLSTESYSCRVVQKALEHALLEQKLVLIKELEGSVMDIMTDSNGNHVIQKIIEELPREHIGFIIDTLWGRVRELSVHTYGCRIIQRVFEHGTRTDQLAILTELRDNTQELIMDQFGNYVIQNIIEKGDAAERVEIIGKVLKKFTLMSKHKFASNVVEKCIEFGTPADRSRLRQELDGMDFDGTPIVLNMIKDQYANYVIQKLLKELRGEEQRLFAEVVAAQLEFLEKLTTNKAMGRPSTVLDRLGTEVARITKELVASASSSSPQLQSAHESTPPLTNAPNSPESSKPPSVSCGPADTTVSAETSDTVRAAPKIAVAVEVTSSLVN